MVPRYLIKVGSVSFWSRRGIHFLIHALRDLLTLLAVLCPSSLFRALQHQFGHIASGVGGGGERGERRLLKNVKTDAQLEWPEKQRCGTGSGRI